METSFLVKAFGDWSGNCLQHCSRLFVTYGIVGYDSCAFLSFLGNGSAIHQALRSMESKSTTHSKQTILQNLCECTKKRNIWRLGSFFLSTLLLYSTYSIQVGWWSVWGLWHRQWLTEFKKAFPSWIRKDLLWNLKWSSWSSHVSFQI